MTSIISGIVSMTTSAQVVLEKNPELRKELLELAKNPKPSRMLTDLELRILLNMCNYLNREGDLWDTRKNNFKRNTFPDNLNPKNGWLVHKQINPEETLFYDNKKGTHLDTALCNKAVIESKRVSYRSKKNEPHKVRLYRVCKDINVFALLFYELYRNRDKSLIDRFLKSDYYKEMKEILFPNTFIIPPSYILSYIVSLNNNVNENILYGNFDEPVFETLKDKLGQPEIFKAFLIHDAINCTDLELRKEYLDAIDEIKQNKEALEGAKHLEHKPAKKG